MQDIELKILDPRLGSEFPLPSYATPGSAGVDLRAMIEKDKLLNPGDTFLCPCGFSVYIKDPSLVGLVYPRSGMGFKNGIVLANLTGVIDSDYQGPLMVPLWNRGRLPYVLHAGERIAQLVFERTERAEFRVVSEYSEGTARGQGGFGSTGTK